VGEKKNQKEEKIERKKPATFYFYYFMIIFCLKGEVYKALGSVGRLETLRGQKVMSDILRCHEKKLKLTDSFPSVLCYWIYLSQKK